MHTQNLQYYFYASNTLNSTGQLVLQRYHKIKMGTKLMDQYNLQTPEC